MLIFFNNLRLIQWTRSTDHSKIPHRLDTKYLDQWGSKPSVPMITSRRFIRQPSFLTPPPPKQAKSAVKSWKLAKLPKLWSTKKRPDLFLIFWTLDNYTNFYIFMIFQLIPPVLLSPTNHCFWKQPNLLECAKVLLATWVNLTPSMPVYPPTPLTNLWSVK